MSYWVAVVARNAAPHISATLQSLLRQNLKPARIIIVDDGSTDGTQEVLSKYSEEYPTLQVINRPNRGYDIRRVPSNVNLAINSAQDLTSDYFMISGDDCTYASDYVQSIIGKMSQDSKVVVASGRPTQSGRGLQEHSPSGSGRVIRSSFMRSLGSKFPMKAGWEAWLLYKAEEKGYKAKLFSNVLYEHVRPRGSSHQFTYWGAAMHTLGYCPLYALGRIASNLLTRFSVRSSVGLMSGYIASVLGSPDPFIVPFEPDLRHFVYNAQRQRIVQIVSSILKTLLIP